MEDHVLSKDRDLLEHKYTRTIRLRHGIDVTVHVSGVKGAPPKHLTTPSYYNPCRGGIVGNLLREDRLW